MANIDSKDRLHKAGPMRVRSTVCIELAWDVGLCVDVDPGWKDIGGYPQQMEGVHLKAAREKKCGGISIGAGLKGSIVNYAWLVPQSFKRPPNAGVLLVRPRPNHVGIRAPEELDVSLRFP